MTPLVPFTSLDVVDAGRRVDDLWLLPPTSLTVRPGIAVVLRGVNGSGKSTLLRLATGAAAPSTGEVTLDGAPVDERDARVREVMAALLHPTVGYRELTLQDHLVLIDQTWGGDPDTCADRIDEILGRLRIEALRRRFLHEMSSGQRQLTDLAFTLIRPSGIIVLDEPEQRLDGARRRELAGILRDLKSAGRAVLLACHDDDLSAAIADETLTLTIARDDEP